jgi:hypothetical protein
VAHNGTYDRDVLRNCCTRDGLEVPESWDFFDSLNGIFRKIMPKPHKLGIDALCAHFDATLTESERHSALGDVKWLSKFIIDAAGLNGQHPTDWVVDLWKEYTSGNKTMMRIGFTLKENYICCSQQTISRPKKRKKVPKTKNTKTITTQATKKAKTKSTAF